MFKLFTYYKILALYIALNLFIGGAIIFTGIYSYRSIQEKNSNVKVEKDQNEVYVNRLSELKNAQQDISAENIKLVNKLLPDSNPGLIISSQIRNLAVENYIEFEKLSLNVNSNQRSSFHELSINIEANGNYYHVLNFIDALRLSSPLVNLISVEIVPSRTNTTVDASLSSYWADYPLSLPSINEPIKSLTEQEISLLSRIGEFRESKIDIESINPQEIETTRENPFYFQDETPTNEIEELLNELNDQDIDIEEDLQNIESTDES